MEIKQLELKDLIPYANNPRKKQAIDKVASSIKEFGWQQPIVVDESNVIIVGHTRYQAAQKLGLDKAPVQVAKGLTDAQVKAYRILDNRANQDALWDDELLKIEVQDLDKMDIDLALTGFDDKELDKLLYEEKEGLTDEDAIPKDVESRVKKGDLWQLGNHRLLCGDATSEADVAKLVNKNKIDLVFTDPPYGIDVVKNNSVGGDGKTKFTGKIGGSNIVESKTYSKIIGDNTTETAKKFYELCININLKNFILWGGNYFTNFLLPSRCWIIWDKEMTGNFSEAEMAWTSFEKGGVKVFKHLWNGLSRKGNRKDELKSRIHPTQKPVGLFCEIFKKFTDFKTIYDGFLGSGSTLIACEKTNRSCYGLELDPKYCDVIIKRWEDYTGQTAQLLERGTDTNSFKEDEQWQDQKNIKSTEKKSLN
jgi:DNA modification methylase